MAHDDPTLPTQNGFAPHEAYTEPTVLTVPDAFVEPPDPEPRALGEMPTWPLGGGAERPQWIQRLGPRQRQQTSAGSVSPLAFGVSLGANVVLLAGLLGVLGVLLLSNAGAMVSGGNDGPYAPGGSTHGRALSTPTVTGTATATATATATSTPRRSPTSTTASVGWLQVVPSTVPVGCSGGGQSPLTSVVLLVNNGPQTVDWQVALSAPAEQAGVVVDPQQGVLAAGASMLVQFHISTQSTVQQGGAGPQGAVDFAPTAPKAGPPASLTYTTVGCH